MLVWIGKDFSPASNCFPRLACQRSVRYGAAWSKLLSGPLQIELHLKLGCGQGKFWTLNKHIHHTELKKVLQTATSREPQLDFAPIPHYHISEVSDHETSSTTRKVALWDGLAPEVKIYVRSYNWSNYCMKQSKEFKQCALPVKRGTRSSQSQIYFLRDIPHCWQIDHHKSLWKKPDRKVI